MYTYFFVDADGDTYEVDGDSLIDALCAFDIEHGAGSEMLNVEHIRDTTKKVDRIVNVNKMIM